MFGQTLSDFNRRSLTGFTFNSGLVFKATDDDVLRALASRGLQLPSMEDIGQQQYFPPAGGSGAIGWIGNPNLRPTAVTNIEADWDHAFRSLNATLRMAVFGQANQSLFGWDAGIPYTVGPVTFTQSVNVGASQEIGAEVSLKGVSRQGVRWYGSYAFATIHDHIDGGIAPGVYTAFASSTPTNTVKFGLGKDFGGWELDAHGRLQSKFTDYLIGPLGYGPVVIKPYLTVDARAAYRLTTHLTAAVVVEQLNAAEQYQRSGVPVERRVLATLSAHY